MMTVGHHLRPTVITSRDTVPSLFLRCDFAFSAKPNEPTKEEIGTTQGVREKFPLICDKIRSLLPLICDKYKPFLPLICDKEKYFLILPM